MLCVRLLNLSDSQKLTSLTTACCILFLSLPTPKAAVRCHGHETSQGKWKKHKKHKKTGTNAFLDRICWRQWPKNDRKHHLAGFSIWGMEGPHSPGLCGIIDGVSEKRQSPGSQVPYLKRKQAMLSRQEEMLYFSREVYQDFKSQMMPRKYNWSFTDSLVFRRLSFCFILKVYL